MNRFVSFWSVLLTLLLAAPASSAENSATPQALRRYVERPDESFSWTLHETTTTDAGRIYQLRLTSQTWQGIDWRHAVEVYEPVALEHPGHGLLFVTGGSRPSLPGPDEIALGMQLAEASGARVIMLHQTPNQPLLGGRREDDLISETWLRYLESGDETWPLLLPMVKSAVRAMDAVQQLSRESFPQPIERFVITGASKRGWTSWLTPVVDERVIATAPIVIDVLNFRAQMNHQLETWGDFSIQIRDYTRKGLVKRPGETESDREAALRRMMDPFSYRGQLTLPKLLIVGTNDPYWPVDAMNLYWKELSGAKYVRQVPDAGHGLEGGRDDALATLAIFFRHVVTEQRLPALGWDLNESPDQLSLTLSSETTPRAVRLWTARSADNDFRDAEWRATALTGDAADWPGMVTGTVARPATGHVALFGEFEFDFAGLPWSLTTLVYRR